jgi:hypothetical protein
MNILAGSLHLKKTAPGRSRLVFEKPLHDESTFNANDGKRRFWSKKGEQQIRPKGRGKEIMISRFLTPGGILKVPGCV